MTSHERHFELEDFYKETAPLFLRWSPDPKKKGLYAMHIGYQDWQKPVSNSTAALQMSQKIIELSEIKPEHIVLDAGCGVGSLTFEINSIKSEARVYGIDISIGNIHLANQYKEHKISPYPIFSVQDYELIAFQSGIFLHSSWKCITN